MSSFRLRRATRSDGPAVAELVAALDLAILGRTDYSLAELEEEWRLLDVEHDAWVVTDEQGRAVGYGTVELRPDAARTDGYVHPDAWGQGVGGLLVGELEAEVRRRGADRVRNATLVLDERAQELLRGCGYAEVRRFWQMRIDLTEAPGPARWPAGVAVASLDVADAAAFHAALDAAFAGTVCLPERMGAGWVSRLFTAREWRGRGIGAALLADAFGRFWSIGRRRVGLGVDAQSDTGAQRLYERAGMHVHFGAVIFERALEPA